VGVWIETSMLWLTRTSVRSRPVWACGLKPIDRNKINRKLEVAPRVGVWIETCQLSACPTNMHVAPRVGVWIETSNAHHRALAARVAPRVGVWIETTYVAIKGACYIVAPRVGVWIETRKLHNIA